VREQVDLELRGQHGLIRHDQRSGAPACRVIRERGDDTGVDVAILLEMLGARAAHDPRFDRKQLDAEMLDESSGVEDFANPRGVLGISDLHARDRISRAES